MHHGSFFRPTGVTKLQGNSTSGGVKYTGLEKCATFDKNRRLSRKRYETGTRLLWFTNRKSWIADRFSDDLERPCKAGIEEPGFPAVSIRTLVPEQPNLARQHVFSHAKKPHPNFKKVGSSVPKIFRDCLICHYGLIYIDQIRHGNTRGGGDSMRSNMPLIQGSGAPAPPSFWDLLDYIRLHYKKSICYILFYNYFVF